MADKISVSGSRLHGVLFLVVLLGLGGVLGYWVVAELAAERGVFSDVGIGVVLVGVVVAYYVSVLAHELGHLLLGRVQGFRLQYFMVGLVMLKRQGSRWVLGRNRFNVLGGFTIMTFPDRGDLRRLMFWYVAGGPLASLLVGLVAWWGYVYGDVVAGVAMGAALRLLLLLLAAWSVWFVVLSLWPRQIGLMVTDGRRLQVLVAGGEAMECELLFLQQYQASIAGTRPADYDAEALYRLAGDEQTHPYVAYAHLYLYYYHMDRGEWEAGRDHLAQACAELVDMPDLIRQGVEYEWAFFQALFGQPHLYYDDLWPSAQRTLLEPGSWARLRAARAWKKGELDKARALIAEAKRELPNHVDRGISALEGDWVYALEQRIEEG